MCLYVHVPAEASGSPELELQGVVSYFIWHGCRERNPDPLQEQYALLTTKRSLSLSLSGPLGFFGLFVCFNLFCTRDRFSSTLGCH